MAIVGLSQFKYTTDWSFETSAERDYSFVGTVAIGKLVLQNSKNDEIRLKYRCVSLGVSKGLPVGYSESQFSDDSHGVGPVYSNKYFDDLCFPCRGWIIAAGGTMGVFQADNSPNGEVANIVYFGFWPFAGLRCYGVYRGTTPGGGVSGGPASFSIDDD